MERSSLQAITETPYKTIILPTFEYYSASQLGSPSLMNADHGNTGCYTRDGCAENNMLQVHFDDSLSLCFLPSTSTIPAAYYTSQYPNSNFDASKLQLQRLQLQHQQYQVMFLQHQWRLLGCQIEFPMQDNCEAPSPIYLPQSNLVPQNHCHSWILQGLMDSHASMRRLSSYAEETIADLPYFNHPTYESPTITQLSSSEASSPELDQVPFEKPRRMPAPATVSDNEYYDKLNISATGSTAIELSPIPSPQMTVTECKRYRIKQELADSEPEERVTPKKKERLRSPVKRTGSESKSHPCRVLGCKVVCSSLPSLLRHIETHKWKGSYTPIRCEACQRALCNEYSAQRHIKNSKPTSRCYQMRVYSVMKSKTEVEATLRFYPEQPHGKKAVRIDLEYARAML